MQAAHPNKKCSRYTHEDEIFWKNHQSNFAASGLTRVAYCRKNSVHYNRFTYWRKKLTERSLKSLGDKRKLASKRTPLLPVQVKPQINQSGLLCSLTLKNGLSLQIHDPMVVSFILERVI